MTTSTCRALTALLLSITGCQGPNLDYDPPPPDGPVTTVLTVPLHGDAPQALGGTWTDGEFRAAATPESCQDPAQAPVLVYRVPLDRATARSVTADPFFKVVSVTGAPAVFPGCTDQPGAEILFWTDQYSPRPLPTDRFEVPSGSTLFLGLRLRGVSVARVGGIYGTLVYVR